MAFCLSYRRYTDTAIIRTLVRQLVIDRTLKQFVLKELRKFMNPAWLAGT